MTLATKVVLLGFEDKEATHKKLHCYLFHCCEIRCVADCYLFIVVRFTALLSFVSFYLLQLIFVYVQMDNEDVGKPVSEYFGITGEAPKVIFPYILFLFRSYKFSLSVSLLELKLLLELFHIQWN